MQNTIQKVQEYFMRLPEDIFPDQFKTLATVILSGSTGWEIPEGFDEKADWDLHILLPDEHYLAFIAQFGPNHKIDDHQNKPIVFGQIHNIQWLTERLAGKRPGSWPLYLWIYTRCQYILDPLGIQALVAKNKERFIQELDKLRQEHFVLFSVRRLDTATSASRGIITAVGINRGEMVKAALQTFSLIHGEPYPYNKWLAKHIQQMGPEGDELVKLCNRCLTEIDLNNLKELAKNLRDKLEIAMEAVVGNQPWIKKWWEFNEN